MSTAQLGRSSQIPKHLLVSPCQMAKNQYFKLNCGPLTRKFLVKPRRKRKSCCKGFRRSHEAWKTLLSPRRSSWQSSGPSYVQTLIQPRRRISQLPGSARAACRGSREPSSATSFPGGRWRVLRARCWLRLPSAPWKTKQPKRGGVRARQRNWIDEYRVRQ